MVDATLVTVHGFWSSPATWDRLTAVWSADEGLRGLGIRPFGYPAPKRGRWPLSPRRIPDFDDIAQTLATTFAVDHPDDRPVVIVSHSQGGLVVQRFLTWMVHEGRGRELSRIASVVLLSCPNNGSQYLMALRRLLGYRHHPQAGGLEVLDKQIANTQRVVLQRIVNAGAVGDHECPIPVHVYAGDSDKIVTAASAQAAFPGSSTVPGDHFSVLDPAAPGSRTAATVRHHLLADVRRWQAARTTAGAQRDPEPDDRAPATGRAESRTAHRPPADAVAGPVGAAEPGPQVVEGPVALGGNVILSGKYVAGHDIVHRYDGRGGGQDRS